VLEGGLRVMLGVGEGRLICLVGIWWSCRGDGGCGFESGGGGEGLW